MGRAESYRAGIWHDVLMVVTMELCMANLQPCPEELRQVSPGSLWLALLSRLGNSAVYSGRPGYPTITATGPMGRFCNPAIASSGNLCYLVVSPLCRL